MNPTIQPQLDLPRLVADLLVDTGGFDWLVNGVARALRAIPTKVVAWLGPELHTPTNSTAPVMTFAGGELVNGVVFVEASTPSYWLLVKASTGRGRPASQSRDAYTAPRRAAEQFGTAALWPEAAPPFDPMYEHDLWRR